METKKIKLTAAVDKPHLTYKALSVLYKYDVGLIWMEVYAFVAYLKLMPMEDGVWEKIKQELENLEEWESVEEIDLFPFEEKDTQMRNVLDLIPHGVVLVSKKGEIEYLNNYAAENILVSEGKDLTGVNVRKFIHLDQLIASMDSKKGKKHTVTEKLEIGNQLYQVTLQVMKNDEGVLTGYLISFYDIDKSSVFSRYDNPITFDDIIGESKGMVNAINEGKQYAKSDSPVLITGESGTGKELFARAIHHHSSRKNKPFIAVNCAAIPDQLLESELFGYEPGTFTGATKEGKAGIFEVANGGTVFLDEIGEMAPHIQAKLLRVLQERKVRRVGGHREIPIDSRLISATNQNLDEMVRNKEFRLDLLFRINIFNINIPPLRERKEEIPVLFEYFSNMHAERYGKTITGIEPEAMRKLIDYDWPGNVREFQNVLERAVALSTTKTILAKDIILNYQLTAETSFPGNSLKECLETLERQMITEALRTSGSIRGAAKKLHVTHTLLINRLKKYGISRENLLD